MASGKSYLEGSTVRAQAEFRVLVDGVLTLTDPDTVTLKLKSPSGTTTTYTYSATVAKVSTGIYRKDIGPTILNAPGLWWYRWIGTGAAAGVAETAIKIMPSEID